MGNDIELACTSVMLPDWELEETFERVAGHGLAAVELRVRDNPPGNPAPSYWGRHLADVSPANVQQKVPAIRSAVARTGVRVCALAPRLWVDNQEVVDAVLDGAHAIDPEAPPMVRLSPPGYDRTRPYAEQFAAVREGIERLLPRARARGVKLLYEIHVGTVAMSAARAHALLDGLDSAHVGAIFDLPNMSRVALEDTRQGMELLGPYLTYCHIGGSRPVPGDADAHGQRQWSWEFCPLAEGIANIPQVIADLRSVGYSGYLSIEDFSTLDADTRLGQGSAYLRRLLSSG